MTSNVLVVVAEQLCDVGELDIDAPDALMLASSKMLHTAMLAVSLRFDAASNVNYVERFEASAECCA